MSTFFKTWDEIADYITESKGYKYLDSPSDWIDAFKEVVKDSRYVGENTYYNPNGFYAIDNWISAGKNIATGLDGGVKSIPTVETIITDTVTGGTVAGAAAAATEATGITITLSAAGWLATGLVGLGLGVAAYEAAPEFWTDLSNAVFEPITGEHLTPEQTEPFLRKKIKTLLSTDNNGNIVTYADRDMLERMYNFIQTHIQEDGWDFYDRLTWSVYTPSGSNYYKNYMEQASVGGNIDFPVIVNNSVSDDMIQSCIHQVQLMLESGGYVGQEPSAQGIVNNLRSLYPNVNNATFCAVEYQNTYVSPTVQIRKVRVTGYVCDTNEDNEVTARLYRGGWQTYQYHRFLRMGVNQAQAENNDYATLIDVIDANGDGVPISALNTDDNALFSYEYDIDTQVGIVKDDGSTYMRQNGGTLGLCPICYYQNYICRYLTLDPHGALDNYLVAAGAEQKGTLPPTTGSFEQGYTEWFHKNKTVGTPTKDGTNKVSNYIPVNAPISDVDTEKIIKNGVNKGAGSYEDDQTTNQNGKDTPNKNTTDSINEDIDNNIKDYNESETDPFTAPEPSPVPLPDYPVNPPDEPGGDSGDTPDPTVMEGVTASGMCSVYNPTKEQLKNFSAWLWSPNFLDNFLKIFQNPMDAIIGLHIMYATPITGTPANIVCGYLDSGVSSKVVTQQFSEVDCGHVAIPEYFGNALDYEPYTQVHVYLPFIGIVSLKPNDVIGKELYIKYGVDAMTGTCLAVLTTKKGSSEIACYTFPGNCACQIPISGGNYAQMITGLAGFVASGVGAAATGNPLMALGAGASLLNSHLDVSHGGAIGSNAGAMGIRIPYVIITRKSAYEATRYNEFYGFPANKTVQLSSCKGYTRVKHVHIEIPTATANEKKEIETILKQGVIIR